MKDTFSFIIVNEIISLDVDANLRLGILLTEIRSGCKKRRTPFKLSELRVAAEVAVSPEVVSPEPAGDPLYVLFDGRTSAVFIWNFR